MKILTAISAILLIFSSCTQDQKAPTAGTGDTKISISIKTKVSGHDMKLGRYFLLTGSDSILFSRLDFYLNHFTVKGTGNKKEINEVFLYKASESKNDIDYTNNGLPSTIDTFTFLVGLDDFIGKSDPNKFASGHPLSVYQNMFWTTWSGYRYVVMEGKIKSGGTEIPFSFHTGLEFKNEFNLLQSKTISSGNTNNFTLSVNLNKVFFPTNTSANILYNNGETQAHADATDGALTDKFAKNFTQAFIVE